MRSPLCVCKDLPINAFGTLGPRPFLPPALLPFPLPLLLGCGARGGVRDLVRSALGLLGFGAGLSVPLLVGNGSTWNDTDG